MARSRKKRKNSTSASPDLTPMIDVTFQLLIFFIICTRFKVEERDHQVQLPKDEGLQSMPSVPKEQIAIRCVWKQDQLINSYEIAIGDRGRIPVDNSTASLNDLVIFPGDKSAGIRAKKALYATIFENVVRATETYISKAGADRIEKLEISFAVNAMQGATSGTAPWKFVSLAIDAAAQINKNREAAKLKPLSVTFKFVDALGTYTPR
jgi:biopolymer transport protein ExbD